MGDQKVTTTQQLGPQSGAARDILPLLQQLAQQAGVQLGDLGELARGEIGVTAGDRALATESADVAADIARRSAERDYRVVRGQTEEAVLGRGLDQSSLDAVLEAIQGGQYQTQLANIGSQRQGQVAENLLQLPFQRAQTQISANQAILQRILGASQGVLGYDIQERMGSGTQEQTQPFDWSNLAFGVGQTAGALS